MSRRALFGLMGVLVLPAASTPAMTAAPEEAWSPPVSLSGWEVSVLDYRLEVGGDGAQAAFWLARDEGVLWALTSFEHSVYLPMALGGYPD